MARTGDDPPRDRTAELRALGFPTRHLGPVQMTTDTALGVTKRVVVDRGSCSSLLHHITRNYLTWLCSLCYAHLDSFARGHPLRCTSRRVVALLRACVAG